MWLPWSTVFNISEAVSSIELVYLERWGICMGEPTKLVDIRIWAECLTISMPEPLHPQTNRIVQRIANEIAVLLRRVVLLRRKKTGCGLRPGSAIVSKPS